MSLKEKYTRRRKSGKEYSVWLVVGVQSFIVARVTTISEAERMRRMLAQSIAIIISNESVKMDRLRKAITKLRSWVDTQYFP